mmetsp:Transcript_25809/g.40020  ORF Transcript_25809/g.40020 Transcript_25809/m.40020 type:complete len:460 (-) Transcript_25809:138-1517(-)
MRPRVACRWRRHGPSPSGSIARSHSMHTTFAEFEGDRLKRIKRLSRSGLCTTCGVVQTHKVRGLFFRKNLPLNNEHVSDGVCLDCRPREDESQAKTLSELVHERAWPEVLRYIEQQPESKVASRDFFGNNALHYVCMGDGPPQVTRLLTTNTEYCLSDTKNENGELPLHCAIRYNASIDNLFLLLDSNPSAIFVRDVDGKTPFSLLSLRKLNKFRNGETFGWQQHMYNVTFNQWACLILLLKAADCLERGVDFDREISFVDRAGIWVQLRESFYLLPCNQDVWNAIKNSIYSPKISWHELHTAVTIFNEISEEMFTLILCFSQGQVMKRNRHGQLPLHIAASTSAESKSSLHVITSLLDCNADAASEADSNGKLPLDLALECGKAWDEGVAVIFEAYAKAVSIRDCSSSLFPFMIASVIEDADCNWLGLSENSRGDDSLLRLNNTFELLLRYPAACFIR